MVKWLTTVLLAVSSSSFATQVELTRGVEFSVLNQQDVEGKDSVSLVNGDNQLVIRLDRSFGEGDNRQKILTPPFLVTIPAQANTQLLEIGLVSTKERKLHKLIKTNQSVFTINLDGQEIEHRLVELPGKNGFMPYGDLVGLTKKYNQENGLMYEAGTLRDLKQELKTVSEGSSDISTGNESEASLQLKIWFSRASEKEKKQHLEWVMSQLIN